MVALWQYRAGAQAPGRWMWRARGAGTLAVLTALSLIGCGTRYPSMPEGVAVAESQRAYALAYHRAAGVAENYEYFIEMEEDGPGKNNTHERTHARVIECTIGSFTTPGNLVWDKVFFHRRELKRDFVRDVWRVDRQGVEQRRRSRNDVPQAMDVRYISDNYAVAPPQVVDALKVPFFYAIKADGELAMQHDKDKDFHRIFYDSPAYLFPLLPKVGTKVKVGESWQRQTQVVVGGDFANKVRIQVQGTLTALRLVENKLCGVIDYEWSGHLDPLNSEAGSKATVEYDLKGTGKCLWDIQRGRWTWKEDNWKVITTRQIPDVARSTSDTAVNTEIRMEQDQTVCTGHVVARLLDFGERPQGTR